MHRSSRLVLSRLVGLLVLAIAAVAPAGAYANTGDPATNRSTSQATELNCAADPNGSPCISSALADINAAHAAEGVQPMVLPSNFASMSVPVQLLNLSNLERVDRGLAPILGLSAALNQDAQTAAANDDDPMPTHFYGDVATGNWAAGYDSTLQADFAWMYDDGLGSDNMDCTDSNSSGCWGHRHDILWHFATPIAMGAGYASGQYGPSMTELFVGGDTRTAAGQADAPIIRPEPVSTNGGANAGGSGTGAGGGGTGSVTGHAAGNAGGSKPRGWAGSVVRGRRGVHVSVGCNAPKGRRCKVTVALTTASPSATATTRTVWLAAGGRKIIFVALNRTARRRLRALHRLRAHLTVEQGARVLLSRRLAFRKR
jgi:hypothetical protein